MRRKLFSAGGAGESAFNNRIKEFNRRIGIHNHCRPRIAVDEKEKMHQQFQERLRAGHPWQKWVVEQLKKEGIPAETSELRVRPSIYEKNTYSNGGDIFVKHLIFEVKALSMVFTSQHDFPKDIIMVDRKETWEKKKEKPYAYINICRKTEGIFVIFTHAKGRDDWIERLEYDSKVKKERIFYFIKKDSRYVQSWRFFINWLKTT